MNDKTTAMGPELSRRLIRASSQTPAIDEFDAAPDSETDSGGEYFYSPYADTRRVTGKLFDILDRPAPSDSYRRSDENEMNFRAVKEMLTRAVTLLQASKYIILERGAFADTAEEHMREVGGDFTSCMGEDSQAFHYIHSALCELSGAVDSVNDELFVAAAYAAGEPMNMGEKKDAE